MSYFMTIQIPQNWMKTVLETLKLYEKNYILKSELQVREGIEDNAKNNFISEGKHAVTSH